MVGFECVGIAIACEVGQHAREGKELQSSETTETVSLLLVLLKRSWRRKSWW